jgi:hypothetical protein
MYLLFVFIPNLSFRGKVKDKAIPVTGREGP